MVFVSFGVAIYTFEDGGFGWTGHWLLWLLLAGAGWLGYASGHYHVMSAGADWFRDGQFIKTYELTSVRISGYAGGWNLILKDKDGREATTHYARLQSNPRLWDLVYNGILHSICDGASVNRDAVIKLRLDKIGLY
ncbi:hypothetical protein EV193_106210 [Herbihabitans rhizosphaerae]|uniref:Uncharacterized protein n=2 Tax=Herbihabitans rhizosphaerae TaxID=1872711 RepID=A0A4Q7KKH6_9PSEU|nr:hypothetical protein EV193_106210 [Herbihabitans rhizosphaerae]